MVTTTRPAKTRRDTPARWATALARARAEHITVIQHSTSGVFFATSAGSLDLYRVRWFDCECAAGRSGDPVCKHRAAFREHCREDDRQVARMLAASAPTFDEVAAATVLVMPAPARACTDCLGTGTARMYTGGRHNAWVPVTCSCQRRAA